MEPIVTPSPDMPASGMSAEPVAWRWRPRDSKPEWPWQYGSPYWPVVTHYDYQPLYTAASLTQELAAKDKEIEGLIAAVGAHVTVRSEYLAQLTALRSLATEAAETLEPLAGYAISSIGSDLDGWVVKLANNAQQPTFNDFDRVRRTLSRLNGAVKP